MVVETLLLVGLGMLGSAVVFAVGGIIHLNSTKMQIAAETDRRRGNLYLERKVGALMDLHGALKQTRRIYKRKADRVGHNAFTRGDLDEAIERFDEYHDAMDRASVFLEEDQHQVLLKVSDLLFKVNANFEHALEDNESAEMYDFVDLGLPEYNDRFDAAEETLQEEMKGPIDVLEDHAS